MAGKEEKGADDKPPEAHDPVRDGHDQETTITEVLPDIDKKIALDGSISTVFVSGKDSGYYCRRN